MTVEVHPPLLGLPPARFLTSPIGFFRQWASCQSVLKTSRHWPFLLAIVPRLFLGAFYKRQLSNCDDKLYVDKLPKYMRAEKIRGTSALPEMEGSQGEEPCNEMSLLRSASAAAYIQNPQMADGERIEFYFLLFCNAGVLHSIVHVCIYQYQTHYVICTAYFCNVRSVDSDVN